MQVLFILAVVWGLIYYRNEILGALYSKFRSSKKDGHNALTYTLSSIRTQLTDHERIVFRDNVDHLFRAIKRTKGFKYEVDVRYLGSLLHRAEAHSKLSASVMETFTKTFKIISEAAETAPGNLEFELSVNQIYIFLKDNI